MTLIKSIVGALTRQKASANADPLISVVIPSYNHSRYISEAVLSVMNQSFYNWELIVIDDGSTDDSWPYLSTLTDPRITVFRQANQGAHNTINRGLALCRGQFLTILNSDDVFDRARFRDCLDLLQSSPLIDLVVSWVEIIDQDGTTLGLKKAWHNCEPWPLTNASSSFAATDNLMANILQSNFAATTSNIFMRRRVYDGIGGMRNLRYAHDWDFILRAALSFGCQLLPKPLLKYRVHPTNTIKTGRAEMLLEICMLMAIFMPLYAAILHPGSIHTDRIWEFTQRMFSSFNFQNNDAVFRAIMMILVSPAYGANLGEGLLADADLRHRLTTLIQE